MAIRIPRGSYNDESIKPAWLPIARQDGTPLKPIIRCACAKLIGLGLHHVHPDGRVTASFYHWWPPEELARLGYEQGCGFHEHIELDGWDGGEFLPEPR